MRYRDKFWGFSGLKTLQFGSSRVNFQELLSKQWLRKTDHEEQSYNDKGAEKNMY